MCNFVGKPEYAEFGTSCRGTITLMYKGFKFLRDGKFIDSTNWRCAYYHRYRCKARAITTILVDGQAVVTCRKSTHTTYCKPAQ